ncbi:hypothetical protein Aple_103840 [Acrocarpospora pleiomorpha]|uniref:Uncharacterized protein n=1 Tax=Acrocarpospora pleiomorpha TaxID=90975 RepID=A0A5M3Y2E8_9ACTN|nr:hypothetical protein [Acrocarpospora pleiomorpha]GES27484.1 hypothetical protein Aple_103840 [Acrocarpospora pleiomorpha]
MRTALVDQGFKNSFVAHGASLGIDVRVVERNPADRGFIPQPKRWVVEQTVYMTSHDPAKQLLDKIDAREDLRRPLRARDLCQALDLPIVAKNTENIRSNAWCMLRSQMYGVTSERSRPGHRGPSWTRSGTR